MHITELTTPYVKRKIIEYGSGRNYNTPVRHWHEVQQVAGSLYKGRETEGPYGEQECDLYLLYDGVPEGIRYMRRRRIRKEDTPEYLLGLLQTEGRASLSDYLNDLEQDMENSRWVGLADIEFVKQFDESMAQRMSIYREGRLEQREQIRQKLESERLAEKAADDEKRRQEKQAQRDAFLGWADDMSDLRFGQVRKVMGRKGHLNGTVMTRREFVFRLLREGRIPTCARREKTTEYRLYDSVNQNWYIVTKTEHDFAKYLLESGQFAKEESSKSQSEQ